MNIKRYCKIIICVLLGCILLIQKSNATSMEYLTKYKKALITINEEVIFGLKPGTLKKSPLNEQEKRNKTRENMASLMASFNESPADFMRYWVNYYKSVTERMAQEIKVKSKPLKAWHKKYVEGYKDCYLITNDALNIMLKNEKPDIEQALADKELSMKIYKNAEYFNNLEKEFKQILITCGIKDEKELDKYLEDMPLHSDIENTWK